MPACLQTADLDARTLFAIRLYSYGTIAMSREWLLADDPVSAEKEVELMHDSMPEPLRKIFSRREQYGAVLCLPFFPDNREICAAGVY